MNSHKNDNEKWVEFVDNEINRLQEKKSKTTSEKKIDSFDEKINALKNMRKLLNGPFVTSQMLTTLEKLSAEHRDKGIKGALKLNFLRPTKGEENFKETQKQIEKANAKNIFKK